MEGLDQGFWGLVGRGIALTGKAVSWLTLAMVLLTFTIVLLRYGFSLGWIWLQESVTYLHAIVFMIACAWTLQLDGHVRVDIFYRESSEKRKALVNVLGVALLLLPFCLFMFAVSYDYVFASWSVLESSREAGGLPLVFLLKSLLVIMPVLLILQGLCSLLGNLAILRDKTELARAA